MPEKFQNMLEYARICLNLPEKLPCLLSTYSYFFHQSLHSKGTWDCFIEEETKFDFNFIVVRGIWFVVLD